MEDDQILAMGIMCGIIATFLCVFFSIWTINKKVPEEKRSEARVIFYMAVPEIIFLGMIAYGLYLIYCHGIPLYR